MSYFTDELALDGMGLMSVWYFLRNRSRDDCHREIRKISRTGATIFRTRLVVIVIREIKTRVSCKRQTAEVTT